MQAGIALQRGGQQFAIGRMLGLIHEQFVLGRERQLLPIIERQTGELPRVKPMRREDFSQQVSQTRVH